MMTPDSPDELGQKISQLHQEFVTAYKERIACEKNFVKRGGLSLPRVTLCMGISHETVTEHDEGVGWFQKSNFSMT